MTTRLTIEIDWEPLSQGSPEERSAFGAVGIRLDDVWITRAEDSLANRVRDKVYVSGYHLAEWLAWNWWRLRWELTRRTPDWAMAHDTGSIGHGYIWPNIRMISDGFRVLMRSQASLRRPHEPLRYLSTDNHVIEATELEQAVDRFVGQVVDRLSDQGLTNSNLQVLWEELQHERSDDGLSQKRRLEALMGHDPGDISESQIEEWLARGTSLGQGAIEELAVLDRLDLGAIGQVLVDLAKQHGIMSRIEDAALLSEERATALPRRGLAWERGEAAAKALREECGIPTGRINDKKLCEMAGVSSKALEADGASAPFSFRLTQAHSESLVVLRSRFKTGRRFALARILGDATAARTSEPLLPALGTYSYRQKLQRAFAAEFLCPYDEPDSFLADDLTEERQEDAAEHFDVSPVTITTQLVNKGELERDWLLRGGPV